MISMKKSKESKKRFIHKGCETLLLFFLMLLVVFACKNNDIETKDKNIIINLKTKFIDNPTIKASESILWGKYNSTDFNGINEKHTFILGAIKLPVESILDKNKNEESKFNRELNCLVGYNKEEKYVVFDKNRNYDFGDDIYLKIKNDTIFYVDISVIRLNRNKKYIDTLWIKINSQELFDSNNIKSIVDKKSSEILFVDYYYGEFQHNNKFYKTATSKYDLFGTEVIFREKDSSFLKWTDKEFSSYKILDTIKINNSYFKLDSISYSPTQLRLSSLIDIDDIFGFRLGNKIRNFELQHINDSLIKIQDLFSDKKYILLDFWGTWCAPCLELTPELVRMNRGYNKLNIVSIAFQKNKMELIDYIDKNSMNWNHVFIEGNAKSADNKPNIIKNLRIESYPTFILIDKDLKIVYRGIGKHALEEIEKILNN